MKQLFRLMIALILTSMPTLALAGPFEFKFEKLAEGVWTGVRPDSPRFPVMGNTTFVIGENGVVVFDGGGVPSMADLIIDKVGELTDKPITHVVISHWHGDHNFGVHRFSEKFPNVQYIAHRFTDAAMDSAKIDYILGYETFVEKRRPLFKKIVETGLDSEDKPVSDENRKIYQRILKDADEIEAEYKAVKVTRPNVIFDDRLSLDPGGRRVELLFLGQGNTEGDIVMWLPEERIVSTGDLIVFPSPYAFNVPPRLWAATLNKLNGLDYETLVPGHGSVQRDMKFVELIIETATSIADQRDAMIAKGLSPEDVPAALDFSAFEHKFTQGDAYKKVHYDEWFEGPLRKAAIKELTGEPMVKLEPRAADKP